MKRYVHFLLLSSIFCCLTLLTACEEEAQEVAAPPPPLVTALTVKVADAPYITEFQGVTQGSKAVEVRARVEALIERRLYTEGDYVVVGQQLFQLERDQFEAKVEEAAAQLERTQREWNRIRPLYAKNAVSQKDRDTALAEFESAKATMRTAQINLDYCQVVSPVNGYTGQEDVTPGNLVRNNSLLTTVNQTDPLYVNFSFASIDFMTRLQLQLQGRMELPLNNAYTATIKLADGSEYERKGTVTFVDTQVNQSMGVVKARAEFPNTDNRVLPGQYVRITLEGAVLKNAILIPQKAVLMTQIGSLVMVIGKDNIVEMRPVQVGLIVGEQYLVDGGLKDGEVIVTEGLVKARPGQPVTIDTKQDDAGQQGLEQGNAGQQPAEAQKGADSADNAAQQQPEQDSAAAPKK